MEARPPLASVMRYGNVRQTDVVMIGKVTDGLVVRVCIGLPSACASLNDDAAATMFERLLKVSSAIMLLRSDEYLQLWQDAFRQLTDQQGLHGLIAERSCRMLLDARALDGDEAARRLSLALSTASEPAQAAAWIEGLLRGSGLILLHDETLWQVIDQWVAGLNGEAFIQLLPLLRRTFSTFPAPERRQIGERVARGITRTTTRTASVAGFDRARAEAVLPLIAKLLGVNTPDPD
jgi:hypothetical protein